MNRIHAGAYRRIIKGHILVGIPAGAALNILDAGCGGGIVLRIFSTLLPAASVFGIDHSPDMVRLSLETNRTGAAGGTVRVETADIASIPHPDGTFDIVTAFDTLNFWPDPESALKEIRRILKKGGVFCIVNGYPEEGTKWYDFVRFKNADEYREFLNRQGFGKIDIAFDGKRTIVIKARV